MKGNKSLVKTISTYFIMVLILLTIIIGIFYVVKNISYYKWRVKTFKRYILNEKKKLLKERVNDTLTLIKSQKIQREESIKAQIKERVYEAYAIMDHLYKRYHSLKSDDEIKTMIVEALRPIRFFNGRGYYFIDDLKGITYLSPVAPSLEGKSALFIKDVKTGKSIVGQFLTIARTKGEGYVTYWWYSPEDKSKRYKKIAYIKLFKPYDWIVGTGEYYLGNEEDLKRKILLYLKNIRYSNNEYLIVMDINGNMLMHPFRPQDVGRNVLNVRDKQGKYLTREFIKIAKKGGGFIEYIWEKPNTGKYVKKISYVKLCPEWGWIIATGTYLDDIKSYVNREATALRHKILIDVIIILLFILFILFVGLYILSKISKRFEENISSMVEFFENASVLHKRIDIDKIHFEEAKILAQYANNLIEDIERNEKRASAILSAIPDLIFILDKAYHFVEYHGRKENLFIKYNDFIGKRVQDVFPEALSRLFENVIDKTFSSGRLNVLNYRLKYEGGYRFFEARFIKLSDEYVLALVRDITRETELQRKLDVTLRSIGDAVISTDPEGRIVFLNPQAERLTGWKEKDVLGKNFEEVFHIVYKDAEDALENPIAKVINSGRATGVDTATLISKDGSKRIIEYNVSPILTKDGDLLGVVLVFRDVTEKKKIEQELMKAEKLRSIGILAGGIAHDFNNTLASMLGYIELLRMHIKDPELIEKLDKLIDAVFRGKELAYKLLTFSKGGFMKKEKINVANIIKDIVDFTLAGSNIKVNYYIDEDIWDIEVDKTQIEQVIQNIVINAKEAMSEGGTIEVRVKNVIIENEESPIPPGEYVRIDIKDSGPGIPEEILDKIFDPFFTTKEMGSGLGLSICYSIVKQHNGYIGVESEEGRGTLFTIYFPRIEDKDIKKETTEETKKDSKGKGERILIMDDEENIREILREELKILGYKVSEAADEEEAINKYREAMEKDSPFDAVILDLTLPGGIGGRAVAEEIRKMDKDAVIIISSGYSDDEIVANYRAYGFRGVLKKPFTLEDLISVLNSIFD